MMKIDTLIAGAGPTGLMMACQLLRFGVTFKIIDKQSDRTNESRAFGIQARSMEIFDNLGLAGEFLKKAIKVNVINFFVSGHQELKLKFNSEALDGTPFPHMYLLSQSETERILIEYLKRHGVEVERNTSLESFEQKDTEIIAVIKNEMNPENETIDCQYLFGCDGAHSIVRKILKIPFEGGEYKQKFFLADAKVTWPNNVPPGFNFFFDEKGLLLQASLENDFGRILGASIKDHLKEPIDLQSITQYSREVSHLPVIIQDMTWMAPFHLHHRVVSHYQKGRAFLLGDAAHIHSPVGAQGMNTGLQDAANLGWKIALKIKGHASDQLLKTYELERQFIGKKLTRTTDRFFSLLTSPNLFLGAFRPRLIKLALRTINQFSSIQNKLFRLMSQLGVRYSLNDYIFESTQGADSSFLSGPQAGSRAPDATLNGASLFEKFKTKPFNVLFFFASDHLISGDFKGQMELINQKNNVWIAFHHLILSKETQLAFHRYGVTHQGVYLIRPDGYIGFRSCQINLDSLNNYLNKLFET
jgi:2-polyprenyl-6-methoxyphenol hydroxylase-like FAD-dependent oxidoreductase